MHHPEPVAADETSLAESFRAVARELRLRNLTSLAAWEITPSQARALAVLARNDPMRMRELAEHLRIVARSTTEVVDALQERGLVARTPDPHDRRGTRVALTDRGTELASAIRAARAEAAEGFFGDLSDADRADLARILRTLRT